MTSGRSTRLSDFKLVSEGGKLRLPPGTDCVQVTGASASGLAMGYAGSIQGFNECPTTTMLIWELDGTPIVIDQCTSIRECDFGLTDINNRGDVIGYRAGHGFKWTRSGGFAPTPGGFPSAINENGDAVGNLVSPESGLKPTVWMASGEVRTIQVPAGFTSGVAMDINDRGQVTGFFQ